MGTDPYGKPAWKYRFDGDMEEMADSLRIQLSLEVEQRFDRKLYETGVPMTEEERQAEAEKQLRKLGVTVGLSEEPKYQPKKEENAYDLMPDSIRKQLPNLYSTEKQLVGDRTAYARYFFPIGAYTAYLLEYDPKERLGFGAVTMGYGWELGYMSLDEMKEVKIHGLGIVTSTLHLKNCTRLLNWRRSCKGDTLRRWKQKNPSSRSRNKPHLFQSQLPKEYRP